jgi:hypothetical protein
VLRGRTRGGARLVGRLVMTGDGHINLNYLLWHWGQAYAVNMRRGTTSRPAGTTTRFSPLQTRRGLLIAKITRPGPCRAIKRPTRHRRV